MGAKVKKLASHEFYSEEIPFLRFLDHFEEDLSIQPKCNARYSWLQVGEYHCLHL